MFEFEFHSYATRYYFDFTTSAYLQKYGIIVHSSTGVTCQFRFIYDLSSTRINGYDDHNYVRFLAIFFNRDKIIYFIFIRREITNIFSMNKSDESYTNNTCAN